MKKVAMDRFRTFKQPLDAQGNPIFRDKRGKWVYKDGSVVKYFVDAQGRPADQDATGNWKLQNGSPALTPVTEVENKNPVKRYVERPVMNTEDLKMTNPGLARCLDCDQYQKLINLLRKAVKTSKAGIVNFVIGTEAEVADAILKAAFPPGSGTVYRGVDGYGIDCANWGGVDEARNMLAVLVGGNVRTWNSADLQHIRDIAETIPGLESLFSGGGGREAPPEESRTRRRRSRYGSGESFGPLAIRPDAAADRGAERDASGHQGSNEEDPAVE